MTTDTDPANLVKDGADRPHLRFHRPHRHLRSVFGDDWFALKAEAFARFFGTPLFLIGQSLLVLLWIALNVTGYVSFDIYPFLLLNLAFSLQAAYAASLILLAQTRQAERDKASTEADALHREAWRISSSGAYGEIPLSVRWTYTTRGCESTTEPAETVQRCVRKWCKQFRTQRLSSQRESGIRSRAMRRVGLAKKSSTFCCRASAILNGATRSLHPTWYA